MAIAEIFIGAFITVLFEKLASADLIRLARSAGIYSELDKWNNTLSQIQAVLVDAGHKHIKDKSIQLWLNKLQHLAYEMDDVLDDLATEAMRRQLKQESNATDNIKTSKSLIGISQTSCCTNFCTPRTIKYDSKMASMLDEITTKLHALVEEKNILGLINNVERSNSKSRRLEETSLVDLSRIVGRDGDKEVLLGKLLGNEPCNENVSILSIVGLGGIGKTTLAQVLYNDRKVKVHFKLMSWVCVSDEFDVFDISKAIFKDVGGEDKKFETLNQLQLALTEKLANRRFLLVLDDVWNENYDEWELLQRPFAVGAPGSKVIVTTRKTMVASVMDSVQAYPLELLSNEKALSLLAQHALGKQNFDSHPTHKLHGEGIVRKCGGLPLALRAIGRVLRTKPNDEEWRELLNSEVWNLQNESKILPALRLSYYDLPPHLKQMFAYCCLFPKDYVFDKDKLVLLWMAEGLLYEANAGKPIETLGRECFEELESRSFFQQSPNDKSRYTMHELINDLATSVAQQFFYMFGDKMDVHDTNEVPRCIGSLKHIRYLNFSNTDITCLPEEVSDLCNLQSLLISGCPRLSNLPNSTTKLINLRHLDISDTPLLNKMPIGIGKLTGLQTLSKVIIGGADEFKISDLKGLPHLQGKLSIEGLHKVINVLQAKEANLQLKKGLSHLEMKWSDVFGDSRNEVTEYEVLEGLRPFEKLTSLGISFYMGVLFPSWVGHSSFVCLSQLTLRGCRSCTRLPTLGHLPSLQNLYVESMNGLKIIGSEFLGPPNSCHGVPFPSLKVLEFKDMQGWEEWSTSAHKSGSFPCLHEISIINCPKLDVVEVELVPSVKVVCVRECSVVVLTSMISVSSSLIRLTAWDVKGLIQLNVEVLEHLREVEYLRILQCDELTHLWNSEAEASEILVSLQKLEVSGCVNLVSLGQKKANMVSSIDSFREVEINSCPRLENYHCPNNIEKLKISGCRSLTSLKFPTTHDVPSTMKILNIEDCDNLETDWLVDNFLSSLEYLVIYRMPKLRLFPEGCLVHLTTLMISSCDNLESIPGHGLGFLPFLCLKSLLINNCKNIKSFPDEHLQTLTSLEYMWISYCPSMDYSFPCGLWPPNLSNLSIGSLKKPISEWGQQNFPTTLVTLILYGENSGATPFAKADDTRNTATTSSFLLPPSLTYLYISDFMDMESISMGLQHLTCLEELVIISCPNLKDLPVTLLPSLSRFWVNYCPKLRKKCSRKGKYWPIISQIPDLDVK
ncbi:putative P-loop containing nucleoside triphosphate hydrolase, leucine-rich repeat domain superfamily [Helianthus debilis subsp. tardiflorus]